jgi:peptide/nickel transport system permease protein
MHILKYFVKRVLQLIPVFLTATIAVFLMMHLSPGDPVNILYGVDLGPEAKQTIRERYRLDDPLWVQYLHWLSNLLQGDFGEIIGIGGAESSRGVLPLILSRLPVTLQLTGMAITMVVVFAVPLGLVSATNRGTIIDNSVLVATLFGIGAPSFWLALFLILVFSVYFNLFPTGDWVPLTEGIGANLRHALLPAIALAARYIALTTRVFRADLLDVKNKQYVETARALGAPKREIVFVDMFKNAAIPTLTVVGLAIIGMISGTILIEVVFGLPGLGRFMFGTIVNQQYAAVQGITVFFVGIFVFVNLVVDILYAVLDPRVIDE